VYGGASAGSSLDLRTTSAGSPSGDVLSVRGTTITLRNILNAGVTINLGVAGASGATINIAEQLPELWHSLNRCYGWGVC
jgi:hypothetical protein